MLYNVIIVMLMDTKYVLLELFYEGQTVTKNILGRKYE